MVMDNDFRRVRELLPAIQEALAELGLDGWLLFDLHARNAVCQNLLALGDLSRRTFVLLPREGEPVALTHGIEQAPWAGWPWQRRVYVGWKALDAELSTLLGGRGRIALETSPRSAVPALDLVPGGVVELVRGAGVDVVPSGELITRFYARWSADDLSSHRRAAAALAGIAQDAFSHIGERLAAGQEATEGGVTHWILEQMQARGVGVGSDCIVATGENAANPHYHPLGAGAAFRPGSVVLIDLWSKEAEDRVYADQTWMGYIGTDVPERVAHLFGVLVEAREAAVAHVAARYEAGEHPTGGEVDDVSRGVVARHGFGDAFIHRTGHSIDRDVHGMGPNIDNLETRETRRLIPGVAFSVEPGIYLPGEIGLRSEINVYLTDSGPEVTTPDRQHRVRAIGSR
jgi:Xaa-Pro dipeptidase